jgi:hypothetical protein
MKMKCVPFIIIMQTFHKHMMNCCVETGKFSIEKHKLEVMARLWDRSETLHIPAGEEGVQNPTKP